MPGSHDRPPRRAPPRAKERGIALVEVFLGAALIALALLFHAASTVSGQQFLRSEDTHGVALETVRYFLERLRTDGDWPTLYTRLGGLMDNAVGTNGVPPSAYLDGFEVPAALGEVAVVVEVPRAAAVGAATGDPGVLREDMAAARFALPFDLSGDGIVDDRPHDTDCVALPIIVHLHWRAPGDAPQVLTVSTYLRSPR